MAQQTITGRVTDPAGEPLVGVNIYVPSTESGTVTDFEGNYEVTVPSPTARLVVSYTGMQTREIIVGNRNRINIILREEASMLDEVVVTAYRGEQKAKDLVGSYDQVTTEALETDRPIESFDKLLEGRIAGVQVQTVTGEPGLPVQVQIRGQGSLPRVTGNISASTQPLFVLDGVPLFDVTETNTNNSLFSDVNSQRLNPLTFVNPDDIESITVLKDASATALYGADAANGVILITTKSGSRRAGSRFNLSFSQGIAETINDIQFLNTAEYVELYRETLFNGGENPAQAGRTDIETDWRDLVQRNSTNADLDLSLSGNRDELRYRLSAGYNGLQSIQRGNGLQQGNFSVKVDVPLGDKLQLGTRLSTAYSHREGLTAFNAFSFPPNLPVRNPDGSFNNDGFFQFRPNPAALLEQNENYSNLLSANGVLTLSYRPSAAWRFRSQTGVDLYDQDQFQYNSALNGSGRSRDGLLRRSNRRNLQWITNGQAQWSPQNTGAHHPSALIGGELQRQETAQLVATGSGFPFDDLRRLDFLPRESKNVGESNFERSKASLYGELGYDYDYRYYVKLNARRDATSLFGGDQQANIFWALGLSWAFAEEPLWRERLPLGIDYGKLRLTYGITGNSRLGIYTAQGLYRYGNGDDYGQQIGLTVSAPINEFLSWERKRQLNLGLDLGFGEGRYGATLEYYYNRTIDALTSFDTPLESGFTSIVANAAEILNRGWEVTLRREANPEADFGWFSSVNFSRNYNELLDIAREEVPEGGNVIQGLVIGRDLGTLYGVPYAGVDPYNGKSLYRLADGSITDDVRRAREPANLVPLGTRTPDFYGGWTNRFSWRSFSLSALINYSYGSLIVVDDLTFQDGRQIAFNNQSRNQLDRWQQPGDLTDTPATNRDNPLVSRSSRYFYRNDYLQLASLTLNYTLPETLVRRWKMRNASVYALVNNLGYLYNDTSPRNRNSVAEYRFTFPEQRAYVLGIKMGW